MSDEGIQPSGQRVVVADFGETPVDAIENQLRMEPQAEPQLADLTPTDVVVAVKSTAVGWVDLLMTSGQYQHMGKPPYTPGLEYAGVVTATGSAVKRVSVGDRVIADGFKTGPRSHGKHRQWGGFATWAVAPEDALIPLPDLLSFDQGANLLGNYETAYHCLIARGQLQAGETVLIHGATGSTGLAAVHVAKLIGATVVATSRSREKLDLLAAHGVDHAIHCTGNEGAGGAPRFRDQVKAVTGGRGVDVVYDGVGGVISLETMRCVTFGARFLIVGWASTPFVAKGKGQRGAPNANHLPTNLIMMKGLDVLGCPTIITTTRDPSVREPRLAQIMEWVESGRLVPMVGESFPLGQYADAMRAKWTSRFLGGCVLHP